jgi:hypothetical protein
MPNDTSSIAGEWCEPKQIGKILKPVDYSGGGGTWAWKIFFELR